MPFEILLALIVSLKLFISPDHIILLFAEAVLDGL